MLVPAQTRLSELEYPAIIHSSLIHSSCDPFPARLLEKRTSPQCQPSNYLEKLAPRQNRLAQCFSPKYFSSRAESPAKDWANRCLSSHNAFGQRLRQKVTNSCSGEVLWWMGSDYSECNLPCTHTFLKRPCFCQYLVLKWKNESGSRPEFMQSAPIYEESVKKRNIWTDQEN